MPCYSPTIFSSFPQKEGRPVRGPRMLPSLRNGYPPGRPLLMREWPTFRCWGSPGTKLLRGETRRGHSPYLLNVSQRGEKDIIYNSAG